MNRPLIYYVLAVYIACYSLILFKFNKIVSFLVVFIFLIIIFLTIDLKSFILVTLFFLIGCISFNTYFNVNLQGKCFVRIIEKNRGYCLATYKRRNLILNGGINNVKSGQRILIEGKFNNNKDYLKGIVGEYNVLKYETGKSDLTEKMFVFKEKLYYRYCNRLDKDKAAMIMACCYGDTKYLSFRLKEKINKLGISHIISVSGYHMALVYKIFQCILGVKGALLASLVYVIFTGSKAAVIRAYIMILVLKLSKSFYKNYDSLSSLSLAGLSLLLLRPYYVVDIGFNLSFLATLGIILFNKKIQRALYKLPKKLNESLSITLSAQIFSMPYAMCTLENISVFFILGNLMLVPLFSIVILLGNLGVIFLKFNKIFNLIIGCLYSVIISIEGGSYLLLKITPEMIKYSYFYGVLMLTMFMFLIFINRDYKNLKYFPMFLMCFIIIYNMI